MIWQDLGDSFHLSLGAPWCQLGEEEEFKRVAETRSFKNPCDCRVIFLLTFQVAALLPLKASCFDFPFTVVILAAPGREETCVGLKNSCRNIINALQQL